MKMTSAKASKLIKQLGETNDDVVTRHGFDLKTSFRN